MDWQSAYGNNIPQIESNEVRSSFLIVIVSVLLLTFENMYFP